MGNCLLKKQIDNEIKNNIEHSVKKKETIMNDADIEFFNNEIAQIRKEIENINNNIITIENNIENKINDILKDKESELKSILDNKTKKMDNIATRFLKSPR